jgi:hypothetical protein
MLDQLYLKQLFDYRDGKLFWKTKKSRNTSIGRQLGFTTRTAVVPRRLTNIDGINYSVSRLVWTWHYGDIPKGLEVDHINRDTMDNRIENLRVVTKSQNLSNRAVYGSGVIWHKRAGKWNVQFSVKNKLRSFGYFKTKEQAEDVAQLVRSKLNELKTDIDLDSDQMFRIIKASIRS